MRRAKALKIHLKRKIIGKRDIESAVSTPTFEDNKLTAIPTRFQFISETNDCNLIGRTTLVALIWRINRSSQISDIDSTQKLV